MAEGRLRFRSKEKKKEEEEEEEEKKARRLRLRHRILPRSESRDDARRARIRQIVRSRMDRPETSRDAEEKRERINAIRHRILRSRLDRRPSLGLRSRTERTTPREDYRFRSTSRFRREGSRFRPRRLSWRDR